MNFLIDLDISYDEHWDTASTITQGDVPVI